MVILITIGSGGDKLAQPHKPTSSRCLMCVKGHHTFKDRGHSHVTAKGSSGISSYPLGYATFLQDARLNMV